MLKQIEHSKAIRSIRNSKRLSLQHRFLRLMLKNPSIIRPALRLEYTRNIGLYWRRQFNPRYASVPANVGINLTRRCGLKCKMCMQNRHVTVNKSALYWYDSARELPLAAWINLIEEMATFRPWVSVTGGEPLLYPYVREFIEG